jgi:hypothetical protein
MKRVRVTSDKVDVEVLLDWDNYLVDDCEPLNLKKGDSLGIFYRNKSSEYKFENIPVYTKAYHPQEKLSYLLGKQPNIQKLMDNFDLVLSI